jgi:hypothetical protein
LDGVVREPLNEGVRDRAWEKGWTVSTERVQDEKKAARRTVSDLTDGLEQSLGVLVDGRLGSDDVGVTPTSGKLLAGSDASGSKLALSTDGGSEGSDVLSGGDWNGKRKKEKKEVSYWWLSRGKIKDYSQRTGSRRLRVEALADGSRPRGDTLLINRPRVDVLSGTGTGSADDLSVENFDRPGSLHRALSGRESGRSSEDSLGLGDLSSNGSGLLNDGLGRSSSLLANGLSSVSSLPGNGLGSLLNLLASGEKVRGGSDGVCRRVPNVLDRRKDGSDLGSGVGGLVDALVGGSSDLILGRERLGNGVGRLASGLIRTLRGLVEGALDLLLRRERLGEAVGDGSWNEEKGNQ